jgi:hypothetical protein
MDLATLLAKLNAEEKAVVENAIAEEKNRGIEAARKKSDEVKRWMTEANSMKDALREIGLDVDSDIGEQLRGITEKATGKPKTELEKQVVTLTKQIQQLTQKATESEKKAMESVERYRNTKLSQELSKAFGEKIHASDYVINGLIREGKVTINELDEIVFKNGESEIDFKSGVDQFMKSNTHIVKNTQAPGAGSAGGAGGSAKSMTRAEFDKLDPASKMQLMKEKVALE